MNPDVRMSDKAHAVCIPFPVQSHINAMLSVAKVLHQRGFYITFVNTEYTHKRILKSRGPNALDGTHGFQFKTIPDGLTVASNIDEPQDLPSLCASVCKNFLSPFCNLLSQLNDSSSQNNSSVPPVSCIIGDGAMSFSVQAALQFNIPIAQFWPISPCSLIGYMHFSELVERGVTPFKGIVETLILYFDLYCMNDYG